MRVRTVRDHVLSIVGTHSLQCMKTAGKNGSKDEVPLKFPEHSLLVPC